MVVALGLKGHEAPAGEEVGAVLEVKGGDALLEVVDFDAGGEGAVGRLDRYVALLALLPGTLSIRGVELTLAVAEVKRVV
ncbi:MAG: hypothetical protein EBZ26_00730, partial [Flavobacteriia bacterium]|nr:hypothetical protein [Flavobacteriia bacterium]